MSIKLNRYSLISSLENLKVCYCIIGGGELYKLFDIVYIKLVGDDNIPAPYLSIHVDSVGLGNIQEVSICDYDKSWNDIINAIKYDFLQEPKYSKPLPKSVLDDILGSMYSSTGKINKNIHVVDYDKDKLRSYIRSMRVNYGYGNHKIPICINFSDESNSPFLLITINGNDIINHIAYYDRTLSGKKSIMMNAAIRKYNDLLLEDVYDEIITTIYRLKNSSIWE
jgi:hypothetical protein